jgi:hypothetical protein
MFYGHLWKGAKKEIEAFGRAAIKMIDNQYGQFTLIRFERSNVWVLQRVSMFPRWSGLTHFASGIMSMTFTDGSKCEDFSKV